MVLVLDFSEEQFSVGLLMVVVEMVVEEEKDRQMEQTQSSLELSLVEDQEVATVGGKEDKLLVRMSLQGSLD